MAETVEDDPLRQFLTLLSSGQNPVRKWTRKLGSERLTDVNWFGYLGVIEGAPSVVRHGREPTNMWQGTTSSTPGEHAGQAATKLKAFISYSRDDLDFADQLVAGLRICGFEPQLDRHEISGGEAWKQRLAGLLRDADTVLFVLSPSSAASEICAWEVEEAVRLGKRIIPVVCRSMEGRTPPQALRDLNYIYFHANPAVPGSGFGAGLSTLVTALNTDLDWLREHTRLLQRAQEWASADRSPNRMLSGSDIDAAKTWVASRPPSAPAPTELHLEYLRASEADQQARENAERQKLETIAAAQAERGKALLMAEDATRKRARLRAGAFVALSLVAALAGWQWWRAVDANTRIVAERDRADQQRRAAETARGEATLARAVAERESARAVGLMTRQLKQRTEAGDPASAINLALEAMPPATSDGAAPVALAGILAVLDGALRNLRERTLFVGHAGSVRGAAFSKDGTKVLTTGSDKTVRQFDRSSGRQLRLFGPHRGSDFLTVWSSNDGKYVGVFTNSNVATFWDAATGTLVREFGADTKLGLIRRVEGTNRVVVAREGHGISSIDIATGDALALGTNGRVSDHGATSHQFIKDTKETISWPSSVVAPTGRWLVRKPECELVDTLSGRTIASLGSATTCSSISFSENGDFVVIRDVDEGERRVAAFRSITGQRVAEVAIGDTYNTLKISNDGRILAVPRLIQKPSVEAMIDFIDLIEQPKLISSFREIATKDERKNPITDTVISRAMDDDPGMWFVGGGFAVIEPGSRDGGRLLWNIQQGEKAIDLGSYKISAMSPDRTLLAVVRGDDGGDRVELYRVATGELTAKLAGHKHSINSIEFSPDGKSLLTSSSDGTARLWTVAPNLPVRDIGAESDVLAHRSEDSMARQPKGMEFDCESRRILFSHNYIRSTLYDVIQNRAVALVEHGAQTQSGNFMGCDRFAVPSLVDGHDELRMFDAESGEQLGTFRAPVPRGDREAGAISRWGGGGGWHFRSGHDYVLAHDKVGKVIHVWRAADRAYIRAIETLDLSDKSNIRLSHSGTRAAVRNTSDALVVFEIPTGKIIQTLAGSSFSFIWSADGNRIARDDGIWDIETGKRVVEVGADKACGNLRAWSEETGLLVFALPDQVNICVYNAQTGKISWSVDHRAVDAHNREVTWAGFNKDGSRMMTVSADDTVRLWNATDGTLVAVLGTPLRSYDEGFRFRADGPQAAFSSDRKLIVVGHRDAVRVWDVSSGVLQSEHKHTLGFLSSLDIGADGSRVVAAGQDGGIMLWERVPSAAELIERARREVPRCIDREERTEFGLEEKEPDWCLQYRKWPYGRRRVGIDLTYNPDESGYRQGTATPPRGVRIERVVKHLPGDAAGLVSGDVILAINGNEMARADTVNSMVDGLPAGQPAVFDILRGRQGLRISVAPAD